MTQATQQTTPTSEHRVWTEPNARRVRALFGGQVVADSIRTRCPFETGLLPVYYFPRPTTKWS